jgi:2-(1,2-epoxy-1,2-dihydrophenyl)acetyl-CoA isomerase
VRDSRSDGARLEIADGIAKLTLDRPNRLNAFDSELHAWVRDALDRIEQDTSIAVIVLTGAGGAFCAGQDLAERAQQLASGGVDLGTSLEQNYNPLVRRLAALRFPVIAAVNGVAAGAGAAVAIACDIVIAAKSARFSFSFAKVGLGPDCGSSWVLPRLVGHARALGLMLTAETIDAVEAQRIGLIWKAVDDEQLDAEVARLAANLADGPRAALAAMKLRLRASAHSSFDEALDDERHTQAMLGRHPDYREGVMAFTSKRKPKFQKQGGAT